VFRFHPSAVSERSTTQRSAGLGSVSHAGPGQDASFAHAIAVALAFVSTVNVIDTTIGSRSNLLPLSPAERRRPFGVVRGYERDVRVSADVIYRMASPQ
jgi:hypothetical protein